MAKKSYPVQLKMPMQTSAGGPNAIIRVDRALSAVNHRLYRQSRMYHAKVDLDCNAADGTVVTVWALADTWWTQKAYQLAYETFLENSKEETAQLKETRARWNDFRVDHGLSGFVEMLPSGSDSPTATPEQFGDSGEYLMSQVHDAGGITQTFRWTGGGANTFNIIDQYDFTSNTDQVPTTVLGTVAYDGLSDEMDSGQTAHLTSDGNAPPYNRTSLENHVWIKVATLCASLNDTDKLSTGYFKAPCGLIAITKNTPFVETGTVLNLEVKSGDYKGVGAPTYLDDGRIYASSKKSSGASHNKRIR